MLTLFRKYKNIILYLFFGVCTTLVNILVYSVCAHQLLLSTMTSTCIAWILAVLFAYVTNRKWVFESQAYTLSAILKELWAFFACRLATGVFDFVIMYVGVDLLHFNDIILKAAANVMVIVLNYLASKFIIFCRKK